MKWSFRLRQVEAVTMLCKFDDTDILEDEMGLGKTIQTLCIVPKIDIFYKL